MMAAAGEPGLPPGSYTPTGGMQVATLPGPGNYKGAWATEVQNKSQGHFYMPIQGC